MASSTSSAIETIEKVQKRAIYKRRDIPFLALFLLVTYQHSLFNFLLFESYVEPLTNAAAIHSSFADKETVFYYRAAIRSCEINLLFEL